MNSEAEFWKDNLTASENRQHFKKLGSTGLVTCTNLLFQVQSKKKGINITKYKSLLRTKIPSSSQ